MIISQILGPGPHEVSLDVFDAAFECLLDGSHIVIMIEEQNILNRRLVDKTGSLAKPWRKFVNKLEKAAMGLGSTWDDEWVDFRVVLQNKYVHRLSVKGNMIWCTAVAFE